jgi:WD40 repeat protein
VTAGKEWRPPEGHLTAIRSLAFTPDGRFVATADEGHWLLLWEAATGKGILLSGRRQHRVRRFGLSADGKTLSAVGFDLNCRVWEVATGRKVRQFEVGTAETVRHWEKVTDFGEGSFDRVEIGPNQCLLFGPGNQLLAVVGEDQHIQMWETATGRKLARLDARKGQGACLAFSPDGKFFASLDSDATLRLWELPGGRELHRFPAEGDGGVLFAFSPDGKVLAWTSQGKIRLWDLSAGRAMRRLAGHPGDIECIAFDRDGKTLVSGGRDQTLRVWDTVTGAELHRITGGEYELTAIELLPHADGRVLALLSMDPKHSRYSLQEAITGRPVCSKVGWGDHFAVTPDGKTLAVGMTTIQFRETATGSPLSPLPEGHRGRVTALAFSPDGRVLASGGSDGNVLIWDWPRNCGLVREPGEGRGPGLLEPAWADLTSEDATRAFRAMGILAANGEDAVALLRERLKPATEKDWQPVQRLLADLNSDHFSVRERASGELQRLTAEAEPALRRVLTSKPPWKFVGGSNPSSPPRSLLGGLPRWCRGFVRSNCLN